jgi:hypothetical protein
MRALRYLLDLGHSFHSRKSATIISMSHVMMVITPIRTNAMISPQNTGSGI